MNSQHLLQALLSRENLMVYKYRRDGIITYADGKGFESFDESMIPKEGRSAFFSTGHDNAESVDQLKMALEGESFVGLAQVHRGRVVERQFTPVRDSNGEVEEVIVVSIDVTERERLRKEHQFMIDVADVLFASAADEVTLDRIARLAIPLLADCCIMELAEPSGRLTQVAVAHVDLLKENRLFELQRRQTLGTDFRYAPYRVLHSGKSELYPAVTEETLREHSRDEREFSLLRALGPTSALVVPIAAFGSVYGAISLMRTEGNRAYAERDARLAEDLGRRVALAIRDRWLGREV